MNPSHLTQTSVLELVSQAGIVAKFVLMILLSASLLCWTIIITKWRMITSALEQNEKFVHFFWSGKNMDELYAKCEKFEHSPIAAVFKNGVKELQKISTGDLDSPLASNKLDNVQRALLRAANTEISHLEKNVGWLATTASASPFIGLFGTVWGIMNSFQNIGATGAANLAVVAPGISEALVTTAAGIAAAIPAVIAYNFFVGQIKRASVDIECFSQDFMNIVQRSSLTGRKGN